MPGSDINIRYELLDILVTKSPFHNLTFKQFVTQYVKANKGELPAIEDLKRLYPSLLIDEIVFALGYAKWQLNNE